MVLGSLEEVIPNIFVEGFCLQSSRNKDNCNYKNTQNILKSVLLNLSLYNFSIHGIRIVIDTC